MTGAYGIPKTYSERLLYVKLVYDALVDTSGVYDADLWPDDGPKFHAGAGMWSDTVALEAISHVVVSTAIKIHTRGVSCLHYARNANVTAATLLEDEYLTFTERMYFMAHLLRHFKFYADMVMRQNMVEHYLARIWSTLAAQPTFMAWWAGLSFEERLFVLYFKPYEIMAAQAPTEQQRGVWMRQLMVSGQNEQKWLQREILPGAVDALGFSSDISLPSSVEKEEDAEAALFTGGPVLEVNYDQHAGGEVSRTTYKNFEGRAAKTLPAGV